VSNFLFLAHDGLGPKKQRRNEMNVSTLPRSLSALVVEDSSVLVERLREVLANVEGVCLTAVVDTEVAAVDVLRDAEIDVILLDLRLREGDGFGVLHAIAKRAERPTVVILSNYSLPEYRLAAERLGARHFLDKLHELEHLPSILAEIIEDRQFH
jgi:two-component system, OmpR family, response regulator